TVPVGGRYSVIATLTDEASPAGTNVAFAVTGANPQTGHATVDASGHATFSYTGALAGDDTIVATASANGTSLASSPVHVTWVPTTNRVPVAQDSLLTTDVGIAKAVTLVATDADGDPLTYSIVSAPSHGLLVGSGASPTYFPDALYQGSDSFTFR